ncbi:hypothetical protein KKC44_03375 [Patescibacteria group bacterium]|nr:hypothetical protein [Patescibacteria group bacterium]MBU2259625.1 hypothetical protein [Patescibacteria group bacterium]
MTSTILLAMFLHYYNVEGTLTPPPAYRELRQVELPGSLTISVTPVVGGSVPSGAQRVPALDIAFTASCDADVPVREITIQRKGMGDYRDIRAVYAMDGLSRISRAHELQRRDGVVTIRLGSLVVPACSTKTITIMTDFESDADIAGEHRFVLEKPSDVDAGSPVKRLRLLTERERADLQTIVADQIGKISITYLSLLRRVTYGPRRQVMRFVFEADGIDDHRILAITLTNEGKARDLDLQNIFLPGTKVAASLDGDRVRLEFDPPLILRKNQDRLMILRASVLASRSKTIQFVIQEPSDVESIVIRGRDAGV